MTVPTTWVDVFEEIVNKVESITPSMYDTKNFQYGEIDWDDTMQQQPNLFRTFEVKFNSERIPKFHGNKLHEIGTCSFNIKIWYKKTRGNSKRAGIFDDAVGMEDNQSIAKILYDPIQFADGTRCRIIKRDAISIVKEGNYSTVSIPFDLEYYWVKVPL